MRGIIILREGFGESEFALRPRAAEEAQRRLPRYLLRERVEWFRIVCYGRLAEVCGEYLNTGRHVYLEGRRQTRRWSNREGDKRTTVEVVANQMRILNRAPKNGNGAKADESSRAAESFDEGDNPFNEPGTDTTDQEIPF